MMKKLLILMLVLGLASVANAVNVRYSATDFIDGDLTWSIIDDTLIGSGTGTGIAWEGSLGAIATSIGTGTFTLTLLGGDAAAAGVYLAAGDLGSSTGGVLYAADAPGSSQQALGPWFRAVIGESPAANVGDAFTVGLWNNNAGGWVQSGTMTINVIPEPMTIALLGLGGLFLLRRRK